MLEISLHLEGIVNSGDCDSRNPIVRCTIGERSAYGHVDLLELVALLEAGANPPPE